MDGVEMGYLSLFSLLLVIVADVLFEFFEVQDLKSRNKIWELPEHRISSDIAKLLRKRQILLKMHVTTIVGLVFASTALGNCVDGGDYTPYGPYSIASYALSCTSYPPFTCSYSFNITYAPRMLLLCRPSFH
jgi:hypothetical protein